MGGNQCQSESGFVESLTPLLELDGRGRGMMGSGRAGWERVELDKGVRLCFFVGVGNGEDLGLGLLRA